MTDNQFSSEQVAEMFINGYLLNYFRTYNVQDSFNNGRLSTIFRVGSDPTYELFVKNNKYI